MSNEDSDSLHTAVKLGNVEIVEKLLNEKADINATNQNKENPLHIAIKHGRSKRIVSLLLKNGCDFNTKDSDGLNPLHLAAHIGNTAFVRILLKHNAPIDDLTNNANRETALHLASRTGHLETIKCLLDKGANINAKTENEIGLTVLHHSSACGKTTKLLLDSGVNVNALDNLKSNALHKSCFWGYKNSTQVLVDYGIDVNAINAKNSTALDIIHSVIWRIRKRGWFENPGSDPGETAIIIIKVLAKKIAANEHVNETDLKLLNSEELRGMYKQCSMEIEKMKEKHICIESTVSFYDILTKRIYNVAMILNHKSVVRVLTSRDYEKEFPIYANMLKTRIKEAKKINLLIQLSTQDFSLVIKDALPTIIIHEVFSYLCEKDFRTFLEACGQILK
ncbi:ankyrin-3-like [Belonocnema kinseyi]|uniref:ankyrin-3-like n=1 Tax=Belonocnema kinseyi TaxID=2817044 RepID=UPI00143DAEAC|nr:ankyrin-3-like [Belonocnema kinseyi]